MAIKSFFIPVFHLFILLFPRNKDHTQFFQVVSVYRKRGSIDVSAFLMIFQHIIIGTLTHLSPKEQAPWIKIFVRKQSRPTRRYAAVFSCRCYKG